MRADQIRLVFDYSYWATYRVLEQAAQLAPGQFTAERPVPHGSLQGLLLHALNTERFHRARWLRAPDFPAPTEPGDASTAGDLAAAWREDERDMRAYLARLTDADAEADFSLAPWRPATLPRWLLMLHLANHTMQHRSEAALLLTEAGHSPGDLDLIFFAIDRQASEDGAPGRA